MLDFPATWRNRDAIFSVLREWLPPDGVVLEVASGSGQHVAYFAQQCPELTWLTSDPDPAHRASIRAWAPQLAEPLALDVHDEPWPVVKLVDVVLAINLLHIAPWSACEALFRGAASVLKPGGLLYLYGAYRRGGAHTSVSNAEFDAGLRAQNAHWGVRDLEAVTETAERHGFRLRQVTEMPANNLSVLFELTQTAD
jgi:SAM-dependent methyltransferase